MTTRKDIPKDKNEEGTPLENTERLPLVTNRSGARFKFVEAGTGNPMTIRGNNWCYLGGPGDPPIVFTEFETGGKRYLATVDQEDRFLSADKDQYVGIFRWAGASAWSYRPHPEDAESVMLTSDYFDNEPVGNASGYNGLLAWDGTKPVKWRIEFV